MAESAKKGIDVAMKSAAVALMLVSCAVLAAEDGDESPIVPESSLPDRIASLDRMPDLDRTMLLHELALERQEVFETLIAKLNSKRLEARLLAAYLLGMYRMDQAAPHLARYIRMTDDKRSEGVPDFWFWGKYPAAEALVAIGQPSVPYLIDNLAESDDELIRSLSLGAILKVEGEEIAKLALGEALKRPRSASQQQRLKAAYDQLDSKL